MKNIVISHKDCMDGTIAAYVAYLTLGDTDTEYYYANYDTPPPDVTDKIVYILDFSYSPEVLAQLSQVAKRINMLDHHQTAADMYGGYQEYTWFEGAKFEQKQLTPFPFKCSVRIKLDKDKSGAGLAYENFKSGNALGVAYTNYILKEVVKAVQDRDLWLFKEPNTKIIYEALDILPDKSFKTLDLFMNQSSRQYEYSLLEAESFLKLKEKLCQEIASKHEVIKFLDYTIPVVNCPPQFKSRVGEILGKEYPFSMTYTVNSEKTYCSLRSNSKTGIDTTTISEKFNGGGHIHASGFKIPTNKLHLLLGGLTNLVLLTTRISETW